MSDIILFNNSDQNIEGYPIEEAKTDAEGNAKISSVTQSWETTGETKVWSIGPRETLSFPKYVGVYLMGIYKFLEEVKGETKNNDVPSESVVYPVPNAVVSTDTTTASTTLKNDVPKAPVVGAGKVYKCRYCDFTSDKLKAIGMHTTSKHPESFAN